MAQNLNFFGMIWHTKMIFITAQTLNLYGMIQHTQMKWYKI